MLFDPLAYRNCPMHGQVVWDEKHLERHVVRQVGQKGDEALGTDSAAMNAEPQQFLLARSVPRSASRSAAGAGGWRVLPPGCSRRPRSRAFRRCPAAQPSHWSNAPRPGRPWRAQQRPGVGLQPLPHLLSRALLHRPLNCVLRREAPAPQADLARPTRAAPPRRPTPACDPRRSAGPGVPTPLGRQPPSRGQSAATSSSRLAVAC